MLLPEDHWSCIAQLSAEDMLKSAVIEEKTFNQRTSGPVNAHLTPGPGIYFNAFIHVERPFSLCPYAASFKMISLKSDFIHIFIDFIHVIALGQGQKTPWGQKFEVNRKPLSLRPYVASFKQISLNFDFMHIFLYFSTCI